MGPVLLSLAILVSTVGGSGALLDGDTGTCLNLGRSNYVTFSVSGGSLDHLKWWGQSQINDQSVVQVTYFDELMGSRLRSVSQPYGLAVYDVWRLGDIDQFTLTYPNIGGILCEVEAYTGESSLQVMPVSGPQFIGAVSNFVASRFISTWLNWVFGITLTLAVVGTLFAMLGVRRGRG